MNRKRIRILAVSENQLHTVVKPPSDTLKRRTPMSEATIAIVEKNRREQFRVGVS